MPEFLPQLAGIGTRLLTEPEVTRRISLVTVAGRRFAPAVESLVRLARDYDWEAATGAGRNARQGGTAP